MIWSHIYDFSLPKVFIFLISYLCFNIFSILALSNVDGVAGSDSSGLLSSLLGAGCECEGYSVRIVGHSLGGAIAALLGLRV